jgi:ATP-dependent helicase Lhr and Lhr-like helicase
LSGVPLLWIAAENWPVARAALAVESVAPPITLPDSLERQVSAGDAQKTLVRGRVEISGPTTASGIALKLGMATNQVESALHQLEGDGFVLRGRFTPQADGLEWCERRLLARIHRRTLEGLRRQVQPVDVEAFFRFLLAHHGIGEERRLAPRAALQNVVEMLQGFEAPAGAWEHDLLPARVAEYEPEVLDALFASGEVVWGRLQPPRQTDDTRGRVLTGIAPISLVRRADLAWLLPPEREIAPGHARWDAQAVYDALAAHGALFFDDLLSATTLLPAQVEDALRELAALGLVTSDGFAAVRATIVKHRGVSRRAGRAMTKRRNRREAYVHSGRWSKFPPFVQPVAEEVRAERWAWLLLARYGVVFRDLLARESLAPQWRVLARVYRRLEMRGEIRGGRFVAGVAGEQFALGDAVEKVRQVREALSQASWHVLSAADPLNLVGILTRDARVPATRANRILFVNGRAVAAMESRTIRWIAEADEETRQRATQLLQGPDTLRRRQIEMEMRQWLTTPNDRPERPKHDSPGRSPGTKAPISGEAL